MKRIKVALFVAIVALVGIFGLVIGQGPEPEENSKAAITAEAPESETTTDTTTPPPAVETTEEENRQAETRDSKPETEASAPDSDPNSQQQDDVSKSESLEAADPNKPADEKSESEKSDEEKKSEEENEPEEILEAVNLNNVEMRVIMQKLGDWTGKPIIPTSDDIMGKKITIYSTHKLPRAQAMQLIYAALRAKGIIAEHAPNQIFLKPIAQARQGYVPTLGPNDPLARYEDKSQIVEKFFPLEFYSPSRLVSVLTPLLAEYGHITALENSNEISVIDTVENLIRIERLIKQLDVAESEKIVEQIFVIENGDPAEIVQLLEMILTDSDRGRSGRYGSSRYPSYRPPSPRSSSSGGSSSPATSVTIESTETPIKLIPMSRQGWIIARGTTQDVDRIGEWIKKLDIVDAVQPGQTVIPVRYVDPREVVRLVEQALVEMPGTDLEANIVIEALTQSKQIVVFGSEENRKVVEKLIAQVDLPTDDMFIEKTFKLKHADPDQIKLNIEGLYESESGSFSSYSYSSRGRSSMYRNINPEETVKVVSYPMLKQVTVIANEVNMKKITQQIEQEWDVPIDIEKDHYRILTIRNSDPTQMVELLNKLFSEESSSNRRNIYDYIFGGSSATDEKKKIIGSLYGQLAFESVPGTKKIIVISKIPEAYDVIEKLVTDLDSQDKAEVPTVITLKYADAEDLCDQLNAILNEPGTTATLRRASQGLSEYDSETGSSSAGEDNSNQAGTIQPWWNRQRVNREEESLASNLIGQVRFIPVYRSKAILVLAPNEYMEDIRMMIEELDKPGMQVMLKVVIVEVDHNNMSSIGIEYASTSVNRDTSGTDDNILSALSKLTNVEQRGTITFDNSLNINAMISLLVKQYEARVLNQPTLWTKDNQEAVFVKGKNIAFLSQSQSNQSSGLLQTYDYKDVGVILRIRPNITPEKAVDVTINLEISNVGTVETNGQKEINKLDTTTSVIVNDGQTIMLGGILFQNESDVEKKVPLLGDIPVVGGVFKHTEKEMRNNELLAFITPYVIDQKSLDAMPAETNIQEQIDKPRKRMQDIIDELDTALLELGYDNDDESVKPEIVVVDQEQESTQAVPLDNQQDK